MSRIKIELPRKFPFTTELPVRITDLNYGGHVGNDTVLSIIHEARVRCLASKGFSELNAGAAGLIMSDAAIQFKGELFYGDIVRISVAISDFSKVSFEIYYLLETVRGEDRKTVAVAKTGMLFYDYSKKKLASVPEAFIQAFSA
jgi:acyl-CoA thioesterase FadM